MAGVATVAYGAAVLGFGLVFRPLHNDEGVTLQVASHPSAREVLDVAVNDRHGPPLHYLLVHASLVWHDDVLGLRVPSALLGIVAVALAFFFGRELLGRAGGSLVCLVTATFPVVVHLAQFARGYTAMLAASFASLWLLLLLVRTRRARYVLPYAVSALLLAAAHPFGLFALFSEVLILAVLGLLPLLRGPRDRRALTATGVAMLGGLGALALLWTVYSGLRDKYGVGDGRAVIDVTSSEFWTRLGNSWSGSSRPIAAIALAVVALAGIAVLARENRRAAIVVGIWIGQPVISLTVLTATSSDFAPERHLLFLLPGFAAAIAALLLFIGRRVPRHGPVLAGAVAAALLIPAVVSDVDNIGGFTPDLRNASRYLADRFGADDVLLSTAGVPQDGVQPRLYGAYAVLGAFDDQPLSRWNDVGGKRGCDLVALLDQTPVPQNAWLIMRSTDSRALGYRLARLGGEDGRAFGEFLVVRFPLHRHSDVGALNTGARAYRAAITLSPNPNDFGDLVGVYRQARAKARLDLC
ncbi:MAG: mannosyltransferase [Gaiellales bacterium]|jgi:4-amino-4-deoxy-L-arabinose transferase-like glycosyltransferase|nr:mannosyltransferase [Gaiellales bacterium]